MSLLTKIHICRFNASSPIFSKTCVVYGGVGIVSLRTSPKRRKRWSEKVAILRPVLLIDGYRHVPTEINLCYLLNSYGKGRGWGGYNLAYKFIPFSPNSFKRYRMLLNVLRILLLNKVYFFLLLFLFY